MATYEDVVQKDLELLWSIQDYCYRTPWINSSLARIVSKNPLKDIVIILWGCFAIGLFDIGAKHFWLVTINATVAFVARKLIEAKRPVEYDIRLQPMTDLNAESYGFPSLESYLSIVILGDLIRFYRSTIVIFVSVSLVFIVGFSRVYSRCRFPHQIVGSWILGFVGFSAVSFLIERFKPQKLSDFDHGAYIAFVLLGITANFALNMENNDSRILRIPKEEFIKVMSEIVYGSPENDNGVTKEEATENDEVDDASEDRVLFYSSRTGPSTSRSSGSRYIVDDSPRTKITKSAQAAANEKKTRKMEGYVKSDSLYFLQRSIQAREKEWKSLLEDKRDVSHLRNRLYTSVTPRDSSQADFEYAVLEKKT